jgi:uncharacterized protein (TIGR02147 family)
VNQNGFQLYLRGCFDQRKNVRPGYSLRAFARDLKLSPSELSLLLSGRRNASLETLNRVLEHTKAPEAIRSELQSEWNRRRVARLQRVPVSVEVSPILQVALDQLALYRTSYSLTILEALRLKKYSKRVGSPSLARELAKGLRISIEEVKSSLQILTETGLLTGTPVSGLVLYSQGQPNPTIRSYHQQILNRCRDAIEELPMNDRINLTAQIPLLRSEISTIRTELAQFQSYLIQKYALKETGDDVLVLTIAGMLSLNPSTPKKENV